MNGNHIVQLLLVFIGGMTVLLLSSQLLLTAAKNLAIRWKLSPLFLALIIVALGTNIPELTFTVSTFFGGNEGLAIGNIVGSNIANLLLVFGVGIIVARPRIGTNVTIKNALLMLIVTLLFLVLRTIGISLFWQGALLLLTTAVILLYQYVVSQNWKNRDDDYLRAVAKPGEKQQTYHQMPLYFLGAIIIAAVIGTAMGGYQVMQSISRLAESFGISQTVLGMTLVAVSTSSPELITMFLAGSRGDDRMLVGTIIGSNIYNLGLFAGILLLGQTQTYLAITDNLVLVVSALLFTFLLMFNAGKKLARYWGVFLILLFLLFVAQAFILPAII
jgi:cation:H+ antiporter